MFSSTPDHFKKIVENSSDEINAHYDGELFGGNLKQVLTKPEIIELLKQYLTPFDNPSVDEFRTHFALETLPGDFIDTLKSVLLKNLSK